MKRHIRSRRRSWAAVLLAFAAPLGFSFASAGTGGAAAAADQIQADPIMPVTSCSALAAMDFGGVRDASGKVTSSTIVIDGALHAKNVPFCDVKGIFAPNTHFEIKLPATTWHGQYVQEGCSALCGAVQLSDFPSAGYSCAAVDNGELALATDDEGHTGSPTDGSWAGNSLSLRVVFGLTSEHSLARMSRAIISAYYGQPASYTYYDGCSTGGREALILAQRYPGDFNGIIAAPSRKPGAPLAAQRLDGPANTGRDGRQVLTSEKIPALHAAVVLACGNAQGVIWTRGNVDSTPPRSSARPATMPIPA